MINIDKSPLGVTVHMSMNLIDDEKKTCQVFSPGFTKIDGPVDPVDSVAINKEIIFTLRKQFDIMMRDLEYLITKQKRNDYTINCGRNVEGYELTNRCDDA